LIGFQVIAESIPIGALRRKFFSKEFFAKEFPSLKVPPQGGTLSAGGGDVAIRRYGDVVA